ncbi:MAG: SMI1/KNR4 family protein [Daejeonella sp.]
MNWKEYIITGLSSPEPSTRFSFNSPATERLLADLKVQFGLDQLPDELEELYKQTNGINELLDGQVIAELIWPIERVIEANKEYRTGFKDSYMSFDQLLFISDAGNGDLFGFVTLNGKFERSDIFVWNHEDDSRTWVAPNLTKFIEGWTNGTITV